MNTMTYKGYSARVEFDAQDRLSVGQIADVRKIMGFHADSVEGLEAAFNEALDDCLAAARPFAGQAFARRWRSLRLRRCGAGIAYSCIHCARR